MIPNNPVPINALFQRTALFLILILLLSGNVPGLAADLVPAAARVPDACIGPDCIKTNLPVVMSPAAVDTARLAAKDLYNQQYLSSENISAGWTGSKSPCNPGTTSQAFRDAVLRRINYFRVMAGVPPLKGLNSDYNSKAQAAALMMNANASLNHTPPNSWVCFSTEGHAGAGSSNLALGSFGPSAISLYMSDPGGGNTAAGHRRWILNPPTQYLGTGDVPADPPSNSLYVLDSHIWDPRPPVRYEFVAWPPPGYVPYQVVYPRWSFSYPDADFSQATVSLQSNGGAIAVTRHAQQDGFGENTLVWDVNNVSSWPKPTGDTVYTVTIQKVKINNAERSFSYTVNVFDPEQ